jgi:hypothetical protein
MELNSAAQALENQPPGYLAADRSTQLRNVSIAMIVLEVTFIKLFFISRIRSKTWKSIDVYLMAPSFLLCISHPIACLGKSFAAFSSWVLTLKLEEVF